MKPGFSIQTSKLCANPGLRIMVSPTYAELCGKAATLMAARVLEQPNMTFGVAVGATPGGVYKKFAQLVNDGVAPLHDAHFVLIDEFYASSSASATFPDLPPVSPPSSSSLSVSELSVPLSSSTSGMASSPAAGTSALGRRRMLSASESAGWAEAVQPAPHLRELQRTLFTDAHVQPDAIHAPDAALPPDAAARSFEQICQSRPLTVAVLGLGVDGRIGWMGGGRTLDADASRQVHVVDITVDAASQNRGFERCVTLSEQQLMAASEIVLLAVNRNKAELVRRVLQDVRGESVAARVLHHHPHVSLLLDYEAAAQIHALVQLPALDAPGWTIVRAVEPPAAPMRANQTVVCISPHPDDSSISAGASLSFLARHNVVHSCVCTTGHRAYIPNTNTAEERTVLREDEARREAAAMSAIADFLRLPLYDRGSVVSDDDVLICEEYLLHVHPHMLFMPQTGDTHETHRAVALAVLRALLRIVQNNALPHSVECLMYEGPWSVFSRGAYNCIFSPNDDFFAQKRAAILEHRSQNSRTPYDRAADALAVLRGSLVPEMDLASFGSDPPRLHDRLELFYRRVLATPADVLELISWLEARQQPKK